MNKEWLLTDEEIANLELPTIKDIKAFKERYKGAIIPTLIENCELAFLMVSNGKIAQAQLAKAIPLIRADAYKQIGDYFSAETKRRQSLTPKSAEYYTAIDWFERAIESLQAGKSPTEESEK